MQCDAPERVKEWAIGRGLRFAWGNPLVIDEAREDLRGRRDRGELSPPLWDTALASFKHAPSSEMKEVRSILVVALPRPAHLLRFEMEEGPLDSIVPPTFVSYRALTRGVRDEVRALVGHGAQVEIMSAPYKLVAARTGLVVYGRNNITYTKEFGSYQQLVILATGIDPGDAMETRAPSVAGECANCNACRKSCPTGAIPEDRFLLRAERCITFFNEYLVPWPDWLPASAHNCIAGCMKCQDSCPMNRGKLKFETLQESFTPEETTLILGDTGKREGPLWDRIRDKLIAAGLASLENRLSRNLRALLGAKRT